MNIEMVKNSTAVIKDILYIIGLIVAIALAYGTLDKRLTVLETNTVTKEELYLKLDNLRLEIKKDIKDVIQETLKKN